ncbi:hypothetical protein KSP40_PGU014809 [Platanthera guangdongensis]|uniref:Uncharacterized protein n=1 Tax=Platanthera guangdongensis TaxID=2320717 RepID=A0ABR2LQ57_9ASPA
MSIFVVLILKVSFGLQDAQILLWNLQIDENFELVQCRDESTSRDATSSLPGALRPSPILQQLPKLSFVGGNCVDVHPLSTLIITEDLLITMCRVGLMKIWSRP